MGEKAASAAREQSKKATKKIVNKGSKAAAKGAASSAGVSSIAAFLATPVGWAILIIIAIILIIILVIGFIGFFTTMPGLTKEKISNFYKETITNLYTPASEDPPVEVDPDAKVALANYIDELGYDVIGYGFLDNVTRDENKKITGVTASNKDYIYAYILANERTYALDNYNNTDWKKFKEVLQNIFLPGFFYGQVVDKLLPDLDAKYEEAKKGMLDVDGWASKFTGEIFDAMYIERDENNSQNTRLIVTRWHPKNSVKWWNPLTWGGVFNVDTFSWSLDGWTPRYGKPIELSLALHLSTMAPDFAYDFCMDKYLQSSVKIKTKDVTYNTKYKYTTSAGEDITKEEINPVYEALKESAEILEYADKANAEGNIIASTEYDGYTGPTLQKDTFRNLSIVHVWREGGGYTEYQKLIDENGNPIQLVNEYGEDIFSGNYAWDYGDHIFRRVTSSDTPGILTGSYRDAHYSCDAGDVYHVDVKIPSLDDMINIFNADNFEEIQNRVDGWLVNFTHHSERTIDAYIEGIRNPKNEYRVGYSERYASEFWWMYENSYYSQDDLRNLQSDILADYDKALEEYKQQIADDNKELREWDINFDTLKALYTIFNEAEPTLKTYQPYISYVRNHWYKDVLFEPVAYKNAMTTLYGENYVTEDVEKAIEDVAGGYQIYEYKDKSTITVPFEPEGVAVTEKAEEFEAISNASGQMSVDLTPKEGSSQVVQLNQPIVISNEKHHWKVKNWLQHGYFFIYDGNQATAQKIKEAKEFLAEKELYDSEDPLLGVDGGSSEIDIEAIDAKAKDINDSLKEAGYTVQLQKISFAKRSALAAFSILESVHTRDAEYVYRDLKELLIDLDYFTRSDFASIELGTLEWIIPEYAPENWPMKKYEKSDNDYETKILSKKSIDKFKEEEVENEDDDNFDPTAPTESKNNTKKIDCDGFEGGLKIIAPEDCKVIKVEDGSDGGQAVTIKFTSANKVKKFTLKIDGITLAAGVEKGTTLDKKEGILGYTIDGIDIKLLLKDNIKAIVNNIEDYMNTKKGKRKFTADTDYAKLFFTAYEGGAYEGEENTGPDIRGMRDSSTEEAFGICQWTLQQPNGDYLSAFIKGMYEMDPSFCNEFKGYIGLSFNELWNKAEEFHETLKRMAKRDRQRLIELEMTYALQTFYNNSYVSSGNASWILDKPDPVIATYFSLINFQPSTDWISLANVNKNMSDEEIIKRLAAAGVRQGSWLKGRMESQAKLAIDMLNDTSISPKEFCEIGRTGKFSEYENDHNPGYLNGY